MDALDKKFYKPRDVAEILGVTQSTLRFWEKEFPEYAPGRTGTNMRRYTPEDVARFEMIYYLLKVEGLKIEAARERLKVNSSNVSKRVEMIGKLEHVRDELQEMLSALKKRR